MKTLKVFSILLGVALLASVTHAQTNIDTPPAALGTNSQTSLGLIGTGLFRLGQQIIDATPTNIVIAPYGTYVMQPKKFGYGIGVAYNISLGPVQAGPIILIDHVDEFLAFNGGLTLQADIHPLAHWGITSFVLTPFGITAAGTSLGGAGKNNGGIQTINSAGADIKFGHIWGGQWLIGGAYGTRTGAGAYSGAYLNGFAGWKRGGIKIGVMLNPTPPS